MCTNTIRKANSTKKTKNKNVKMKRRTYTSIILIALCSIVLGGEKISINSNWSFSKNNEEWVNINLPHSWNDLDVMDDEHGYHRGICMYKKTLVIDDRLKDKVLYLLFEGANQISEVYVNGKLSGKHIGGYTAFYVPLLDTIRFGTENPNEIIVKVDNRHNDDVPPLTADFTFFGGIYRDVYLVAKNSIHFSVSDYSSDGIYISTPKVSESSANVHLKAIISNVDKKSNRFSLRTTLYDSEGNIVSRKKTPFKTTKNSDIVVEQTLDEIDKPNLWSPKDPYLYKAVTQIIDSNGNILDEQFNSIGFRWFHFDPEKGFYLNDKHYKLIGTSRHQDYKFRANALRNDYAIRDLELLKEMGGNFLRIAHYPQDPSVLEACDRLGILASVEIPLINSITESEEFTENSMTMLMEMLRQNCNHPSLIIWCYMNEILLRDKFTDDIERNKQYHNNVYKLAEMLENTIRREDSTRYTMHVGHGAYNKYRKAGLVDLPMIVGWNIYNGWYSNTFEGFSTFLDRFHQDYPDKVMAITEFGADSDPRIRSNEPIRFDKSTEYSTLFHQYYFKSIMERPFVAGGMIWNLADFNSELRNETMPHINNKGILTWDRTMKDQYLFYQTQLSKKPMVKILNMQWKKREGVADEGEKYCKQPLFVTSNKSTVELIHNGESLGIQNVVDGLTKWTVPFKDGENTLVALSGNAADRSNIRFILHPYIYGDNSKEFKTLNLLTGTNRFYMDPETKVVWMPDQPYRKGSFGYISGEPYKLPNSGRTPYGTDLDITLTDNDPVFQTQRVGIEEYKFDVPVGKYELTLNFAELEGVASEKLAYNLGDESENSEISNYERVFDVIVNDEIILNNLNIAEQFGISKAVSIKTPVAVKDIKGISIQFNVVKNNAILNSIQLKRIF